MNTQAYADIFSNPERQKAFWDSTSNEETAGQEVVQKLMLKIKESKQAVIINNYQANMDIIHNINSRTTLCNGLLEQLGIRLKALGFEVSLDRLMGEAPSVWLMAKKPETPLRPVVI